MFAIFKELANLVYTGQPRMGLNDVCLALQRGDASI